MIKIFLILIAIVLIPLIVFLIKGGNFYLPIRNLTRTFNGLKLRFHPEMDINEMLFCSAYINGISYHQENRGLLNFFFIYATKMDKSKNENETLRFYFRLVLSHYLEIDNPKRGDRKLIMDAIDKMDSTITKTITKELASRKNRLPSDEIVIEARREYQSLKSRNLSKF